MPCETLVLVATVAHSARTRNLQSLNGASIALPILIRLYRDGIAYFAVRKSFLVACQRPTLVSSHSFVGYAAQLW